MSSPSVLPLGRLVSRRESMTQREWKVRLTYSKSPIDAGPPALPALHVLFQSNAAERSSGSRRTKASGHEGKSGGVGFVASLRHQVGLVLRADARRARSTRREAGCGIEGLRHRVVVVKLEDAATKEQA